MRWSRKLRRRRISGRLRRQRSIHMFVRLVRRFSCHRLWRLLLSRLGRVLCRHIRRGQLSGVLRGRGH